MDFSLRPAGAEDADFLARMLVEAAFWREDGPRGSIGDVLGTPELAHYIAGWPRAGDVGVVAQAAEPVGAAWLRFFSADDPGYGFVDTAIPELTMGVDRSWRGHGVGRVLLAASPALVV